MKLASACIALALAGSGCTMEQAYYSGQSWQRNECNRIPDQDARARCLSQTGTTYDEYRRQTTEGKTP